MIVTAGAWVGSLLPGLDTPFRIERQVLHWFDPTTDVAAFSPSRCPIHLWQFDDGRFFYGFPDLGTGVKAAFHHAGEATTADGVRRDVAPAEDRCRARRAAAVRAGRRRPGARVRRLPVHEHAGRALPDRPASRRTARPRGQPVFGTRLQVRAGRRGNPGGSGAGQATAFRPGFVSLALIVWRLMWHCGCDRPTTARDQPKAGRRRFRTIAGRRRMKTLIRLVCCALLVALPAAARSCPASWRR